MRPTRPAALVALGLGAALLAYLVTGTAYGSVPAVPGGAPVPLALLAAVELVVARIVRDRVQHRTGAGARPLHPLQVARLAALAKASSPAGAVLAGGYGGLLAWTAPRADTLAAASADVLASALSALAALALVVAALLLERACRVPPPPEPDAGGDG